jgi:hypothetical protein
VGALVSVVALMWLGDRLRIDLAAAGDECGGGDGPSQLHGRCGHESDRGWLEFERDAIGLGGERVCGSAQSCAEDRAS